jgi:hypothetical protein
MTVLSWLRAQVFISLHIHLWKPAYTEQKHILNFFKEKKLFIHMVMNKNNNFAGTLLLCKEMHEE